MAVPVSAAEALLDEVGALLTRLLGRPTRVDATTIDFRHHKVGTITVTETAEGSEVQVIFAPRAEVPIGLQYRLGAEADWSDDLEATAGELAFEIEEWTNTSLAQRPTVERDGVRWLAADA